jgi:hypothetical protein
MLLFIDRKWLMTTRYLKAIEGHLLVFCVMKPTKCRIGRLQKDESQSYSVYGMLY